MTDKTEAGKPTKASANPDAPILTEDEIASIKAQAREEILKERKAASKKDILEREKQRLRMEEGLVTGNGVKDEMVNITIDIAEYTDKIMVNMRPYWHGQTYTVPRHVADSLREMMYRTWLHQNEIDGKSKSHFYQQRRETTLSAVRGASRAPARPDGTAV